jgi:hypothetical protein
MDAFFLLAFFFRVLAASLSKGWKEARLVLFVFHFSFHQKITKVTQLPHIYISNRVSLHLATHLEHLFSLSLLPSISQIAARYGRSFCSLVTIRSKKQKKPYVHVILLYVEKARHIGKVKKREREFPNVRRND